MNNEVKLLPTMSVMAEQNGCLVNVVNWSKAAFPLQELFTRIWIFWKPVRFQQQTWRSMIRPKRSMLGLELPGHEIFFQTQQKSSCLELLLCKHKSFREGLQRFLVFAQLLLWRVNLLKVQCSEHGNADFDLQSFIFLNILAYLSNQWAGKHHRQ